MKNRLDFTLLGLIKRCKKNKLSRVKEFRLETVVPKQKLKKVVSAMKKAHPYEEVAFDIIKLENFWNT